MVPVVPHGGQFPCGYPPFFGCDHSACRSAHRAGLSPTSVALAPQVEPNQELFITLRVKSPHLSSFRVKSPHLTLLRVKSSHLSSFRVKLSHLSSFRVKSSHLHHSVSNHHTSHHSVSNHHTFHHSVSNHHTSHHSVSNHHTFIIPCQITTPLIIPCQIVTPSSFRVKSSHLHHSVSNHHTSHHSCQITTPLIIPCQIITPLIIPCQIITPLIIPCQIITPSSFRVKSPHLTLLHVISILCHVAIQNVQWTVELNILTTPTSNVSILSWSSLRDITLPASILVLCGLLEFSTAASNEHSRSLHSLS